MEQFGKANATPNLFNFFDRTGVLFKWNNEVDVCPEGIVEDDVVLYPSLAAEILGVVLDQDQPIPSIEDKIEPQGNAEDAAACNSNIELFDVTGVDALTVIHANNYEIDKINGNDNNIMSIATILSANNPKPLVLPDTLDDNNTNKKR